MKKTPEQIVLDIQDACKELGWHIAMDESSDMVKGLVIGQFEYVDYIINQLSDMDNYSIYSSAASVDQDMH